MKNNIVLLIFATLFLIRGFATEDEIGFSCVKEKGKYSENEKLTNSQMNDDININSCCSETKCCKKIYPEDYQILQTAKGCKERESGPYIDISALVWQSKEGNLEYAGKSKTINDSAINSQQKEYIVIPDFGWRPGFKADVGYMLEEDNWDVKALWTYYKGDFTHVKKHTNVEITPDDNGVIPLYFTSVFKDKVSPAPRYTHSTGDWSMYFNSIDFEAARNFFVRRKLSVRLLFGLKSAWVRQNYRVNYYDGNTLTGNQDNITLISNHLNFKNDYWGIGPRIGFESTCHMIWGIKLFANTSVSSLFSHFKVKRKDTNSIYDNLADSSDVLTFNLKNDFYSIKPNIQLLLGFGWSRCFRQSYLGVSLGYEMQYFYGQNQIKRTNGNNNIAQEFINRGDLQLHGLTANFKYEF